MKATTAIAPRGFTLVELLAALLILSLLALMSFRGLGAVLDARDHVRLESEKWQRIAKFFARFERDAQLAAPRRQRDGSVMLPAWRGHAGTAPGSRLELSRFAADEDSDAPQRLAYHLNHGQQIELWLWPGLDLAAGVQPARYTVLAGVSEFEVRYMGAELAWMTAWPATAADGALPRAVRLRIVLASGEELVRVFSLRS